MKIRSGFVSNSSSSSFVVRIKNKNGKAKLFDIFKGTEDFIPDLSCIEMIIDETFILNRTNMLKNEWADFVKDNGDMWGKWPLPFARVCETFAKYEKKYGQDIAIVCISEHNSEILKKVKQCPNLIILEKFE